MDSSDDNKRLRELTVGDAKRFAVYAGAALLALALFATLVWQVAVALLELLEVEAEAARDAEGGKRVGHDSLRWARRDLWPAGAVRRGRRPRQPLQPSSAPAATDQAVLLYGPGGSEDVSRRMRRITRPLTR